MSLYELTLVLREKAEPVVPGKVKTTKVWGVRDLAYPIKGAKQGYYILLAVELEPAQVTELNQTLEHNESVLRYLLIKE